MCHIVNRSCRYILLLFDILLVFVSSGLPPNSDTASPALILDVDNTLYQERDAKIETQIIQNTHKYCQERFGLSNEEADELYRKYGSTVEGLKQTLWKTYSSDQRKRELEAFYRMVYNEENIDVSGAIPMSKSSITSTGYSHGQEGVINRLLRGSTSSKYLASNSPSWHVNRVLNAMGLASIHWNGIFTPDRLPNFDYPTKNTPVTFFSTNNASSSMTNEEASNLNDLDKFLVLDDSIHNLESIKAQYTNAEGIYINQEYTLTDALLQAWGLVDPKTFTFSQVKYLQSKQIVDRRSINKETWYHVVRYLQSSMGHGKQNGSKQAPIRIVDVGAGLLSMLQLLCHGDHENELKPLILPSNNADIQLYYTAYESNIDLLEECTKRLVSWGFSRQAQEVTDHGNDDEFIFVHPQLGVMVRLCLKDYDDGDSLKSFNRNDDGDVNAVVPPHLIVGCCFADLLNPYELVRSLIRRFNLLQHSSTSETLVYFPITFTGTTQFLPPQPFSSTSQSNGNAKHEMRIPSDTLAFRLYSKALSENMGHNLDPGLLRQAMEDHGATFIVQGDSSWTIESKSHSYLYETMLYFFGTTGGPQLLNQGWNAGGWIQRARQNRPTIYVSNVDLLFSFRGQQEEHCIDNNDPNGQDTASEDRAVVQKEIQFIAPNQVSTTDNELPPLGSSQVLIQSSCSLISSGTELKIFKGSFDDAALDVNIKDMEDKRMAYPLSYGYSLVGRVVACGSDVDTDLLGKLVFTFSPHATHVVADFGSFQLVPDGIAAEDAIFMPSVETALSLTHDAHVRVGENVAVYGQGLIGLLVTAILGIHSNNQNGLPVSDRFGTITVFDTLPDRLAVGTKMGASQALFPGGTAGPFDVSIEISGNARALQAAIDNTSNGGRVIVGSWYGDTDVQLKLGIDFHRSHKTIQTSQVSEIPASLLGLWSKERRFALTWELVKQIRPSRLLTKLTTLDGAQEAYESLDEGKEIAVAFQYL